MPFIQGKGNQEVVTPNQKTEINPVLSDGAVPMQGGDVPWVDIEDILSDEWDIGAPAMTVEAIRALIAGD